MKKLMLVIAIVALLFGCGGGGGEETTSAPAPSKAPAAAAVDPGTAGTLSGTITLELAEGAVATSGRDRRRWRAPGSRPWPDVGPRRRSQLRQLGGGPRLRRGHGHGLPCAGSPAGRGAGDHQAGIGHGRAHPGPTAAAPSPITVRNGMPTTDRPARAMAVRAMPVFISPPLQMVGLRFPGRVGPFS